MRERGEEKRMERACLTVLSERREHEHFSACINASAELDGVAARKRRRESNGIRKA